MTANQAARFIAKAPYSAEIPDAVLRDAVNGWGWIGRNTYEFKYTNPPQTRYTTAVKGLTFTLETGETEEYCGYREVVALMDKVEFDRNELEPSAWMMVVGALYDGNAFDFGVYGVFEDGKGGLRVSTRHRIYYPLERLRIVGRVVRHWAINDDFDGMSFERNPRLVTLKNIRLPEGAAA